MRGGWWILVVILVVLWVLGGFCCGLRGCHGAFCHCWHCRW
ncbi:hypothetical protein [Desulfurobacterium pacificum]|nr:hypothetical protein [Desulfurobacterium pacificum]